MEESSSLTVPEGVREDVFLSHLSAMDYVRVVHRTGHILLGDGELIVSDSLFDSGALSASYVSQAFVDENRARLESCIHPVRGAVRLAAKKAVVSINEVLHVTVVFRDNQNRDHSGLVRFYVLPESNNTLVVGLPAIIAHFGVVFMEMLQTAIDEYSGEPSHSLSVMHDQLQYPWSMPADHDAPEDADTPDPCSFTDALHFMEMTPDEAREEFLSQIPAHVSPEFRAATRVEELLKDKGVHAFVPRDWTGIQKIEPLELEWLDNMPARMMPLARPIPAHRAAAAEKEMKRMLSYMYEPSKSPIASCLVIADKATSPFIRICGDYVRVNKYVVTGHYPIPHVLRSLEKICGYRVFLDLDLVNAFHQVPLGPKTSAKLSIQSPWGQFQPKFMPEGVAPATFILQETVSKIFDEFSEWTIAIYDNLLVLAHDFEDAYKKLEIIIDRCIEYNLYLKFSKSWLGFDEVHFFGYDCRYQKYSLGDGRKKTLSEFPPPPTLKHLQSFLGAALYFQNFVPHYATLAAPLHEMTKRDARWSADTWTSELTTAFDKFKSALISSFELYYPDYTLPWVLRTDASLEGVGMALFQVFSPDSGADPHYQPILFHSQKFSAQARNWSTIEQEAYAIFWAVKHCSYYLRGKEFVLETDHANLQYMEASLVPKIIRWRIYLQSFVFSLRHIKGKDNAVADWLSRLGDSQPSPPAHPAEKLGAVPIVANISEASEKKCTADELLAQVHGGRAGHPGVRKTYLAVKAMFPGNSITYAKVDDFVSSCAICQKDRLGMSGTFKPIYRTLKSLDKRHAVGVDTLTITPADKHGNQYINVVVVHTTKLVALYPSATKGALDMALALFKFFSTYGVYEQLVSDPGSDLTSEVVDHLTSFYGVRHVFSLVDRHESNGVEGTNRSILRHLKALVADERLKDRWSADDVIYLIQYWLNSQVSHETGLTPFHAHFGSADSIYMRLPQFESAEKNAHGFVKLLDENLQVLWEASQKYQQKIIAARAGSENPALQNRYQPGDLVLFQHDKSKPLPSKLTMNFAGPFEVISQVKNDVQCRHLVMKTVHTFHVERLKIFSGTRESGEKVALLDHDQFEIDAVLTYRGDPLVRTTMEFYIRFSDGDERWVTWNQDLFKSIPYEVFCRAHAELFPLIYTEAIARKLIRELNQQAISEVEPGETVFVDLRSRGPCTWYALIGLPRAHELKYVLRCRYKSWVGKQKRKIRLFCELLQLEYEVDHYFVRAYGSVKEFIPKRMVLVDKLLCKEYPNILPK